MSAPSVWCRLASTTQKALNLQLTRSVWTRKIKVNIYPSLEERLEELDHTREDPEVYAPVDIGLPERKPSRKAQLGQRLEHVKALRRNAELESQARKAELTLDLDTVNNAWEKASAPHHISALAHHYGIFGDLFGKYAYFRPRVPLSVSYDYDEQTVSPVYRGNVLKPKETAAEPKVQFESSPDDLWTLILTNPDGNLYENDKECLHWFVGNIQGGKLETGEVICNYLQPFPPRGTGYHRYVFVLYKQEKRIDFSEFKKEQPCLLLKERSFSTLDFYRQMQDEVTPAGLAWFQADWDSSLTDFFHNTLQMREPLYEYDFPDMYMAPQKHFPLRRQFDRYLDMHRDPKQINKEILLKRLNRINPLEREPPVHPFPAALPIDTELTSWEKKEIKRERIGAGKYYDLYRGSNRPKA
nr:39S ribosomal protein L38, mitochondrial-like [Penaeus vannamei]